MQVTGDGSQVTVDGLQDIGGQETNNPPTLQFQIFPNPSYGKLNIIFSGALPQQTLLVAVSNAGGSMLFTQDLLFNSNTLNLSQLPAGVYYINVLAGGKKLREYKVVKL